MAQECNNGRAFTIIDKFVLFFIGYYLFSLLLMTSSVFDRFQQETTLNEAKTKVSHGSGPD